MAKDKTYEEAPTGPELGNPFSDECLFGEYENGKVFDYDSWRVRDMTDMLDRDGKAKTLETVLCQPIRRAPWNIEPHEGDKGEAEFLTKLLEAPSNAGGMSVPFQHVIAQATSAFFARKAFFEKVLKVGEGDFAGKVVYDKIAWRPTGTCQLARDSKSGAFAGFRQRPFDIDPALQVKMREWITYEPNRSWVYIHGQHRDPLHGTSDLEVALWCYRTKQKIRYLWYSFLEGQSIPKALVHDQDMAQARKVASQVAKLKAQGVLAFDGNTTVSPFESAGKGADQFKQAIDFLNSEMSGSVLAGFVDLTSSANDGAGSYALSKDASDFFLASRYAVADELAESINHFLLSDLVHYNFGPDAKAPQFKFGQLSEADVADEIALLTAMASSTANNLPGEFTYMLAEKVGEYLDFDVDKLRAEFDKHAKEKEEQAKLMTQMQMEGHQANMEQGKTKQEIDRAKAKGDAKALNKAAQKNALQKAGQVGRATGAVNQAVKRVDAAKKGVKLAEDESTRTIIDMKSADEDVIILANDDQLHEVFDELGDDAEILDMAAVNGHHVPGTAYNWRHNWHPLNAQTALRYRKGRAVAEKLHKQGKIGKAVEPDWYQGLKPGEPTKKHVGTGKGTPDEPIKIGLKPVSKGDEGGSTLPFEGKAQKSKVAQAVIKEAEEYFKKKGGPPPSEKQKIAKAKQLLQQKVQSKSVEKGPKGFKSLSVANTEAEKRATKGTGMAVVKKDGAYHVMEFGPAIKEHGKGNKVIGGYMPSGKYVGGHMLTGKGEGAPKISHIPSSALKKEAPGKGATETSAQKTSFAAIQDAKKLAKIHGETYNVWHGDDGYFHAAPTTKAIDGKLLGHFTKEGKAHIYEYSAPKKAPVDAPKKAKIDKNNPNYQMGVKDAAEKYGHLSPEYIQKVSAAAGKQDTNYAAGLKAGLDYMAKTLKNVEQEKADTKAKVDLPGPGMYADGNAIKQAIDEESKLEKAGHMTQADAWHDAITEAKKEFKAKHGKDFSLQHVEVGAEGGTFVPTPGKNKDRPEYAEAVKAGWSPIDNNESANGGWKVPAAIKSHAGAYHYSGGSFSVINAQLRTYKSATGGSNDGAIAQMDREFEAVPGLDKNIVVTRKIGKSGPFPEPPPYMEAGAEFKDWGYGSTSKDPSMWSGSTVLEIRIPKGSKVLDLNHTTGSQNDHEQEILLDRGAIYKIVEDKPEGGIRKITVELKGYDKVSAPDETGKAALKPLVGQKFEANNGSGVAEIVGANNDGTVTVKFTSNKTGKTHTGDIEQDALAKHYKLAGDEVPAKKKSTQAEKPDAALGSPVSKPVMGGVYYTSSGAKVKVVGFGNSGTPIVTYLSGTSKGATVSIGTLYQGKS